jgi:hypothetical protein
MNGYVAFHKGRRTEIQADTSYDAQKKAAAFWKVPEKKRHEITVMLAETNGAQVTHTADF